MKPFNLSIPTPCHESWEQMTPAEQGRFCASCQKTVIDFTNMSDAQLAAFFKKSTGSVCGRLAQDQLDREIVVPAKRIPWVRYFFQFTLPAFLMSLKANAQKEGGTEKVSMVKLTGDTSIREALEKAVPACGIKGKVMDDKGAPIPFATVMVKGENKGVICDATGVFILPYPSDRPFAVQVSSVGYVGTTFQVSDSSVNNVVLSQTLQGMLGGVVVVRSHRKKVRKTMPLISDAKRDTAFNHFSVYPNPARSNGTITLDCKKLPKGVYSLQILALNGLPVCTKQLDLEEKGGLLRTDLPSLAAGQYVIMLLPQNGKKTYTEKIQVL